MFRITVILVQHSIIYYAYHLLCLSFITPMTDKLELRHYTLIMLSCSLIFMQVGSISCRSMTHTNHWNDSHISNNLSEIVY